LNGKTVSDQPYKTPPITESVIELRFAEPIDARVIESLDHDLANRYPRGERLSNIEMIVDQQGTNGVDPRVSTRSEFSGFKRTSENALDILIFGPRQFLISRLAPYVGWEEFLANFVREWTTWKKRCGYNRVARIGMRYINRLDAPVNEGGIVHDDEYLNIGPVVPTGLGSLLASALQARFNAPDLGCHITINTGTIDSPLPDRISFLLDIDISTIDPSRVPQRDDEILRFLNQVRVRKNSVFEACIKDKTREMFWA
jgi:uncharacterized protein (TIGR04255 family)